MTTTCRRARGTGLGLTATTTTTPDSLVAVLEDDIVGVPDDRLVDGGFNWISEVDASDNECDLPHGIVDSSSDEDVPDVELAVAKHKTLRKRRRNLRHAERLESVEGSPLFH